MLTKEERDAFLNRLKEEGLWILRDAEEKYLDDKTIMMGLVKINSAILHFASERLKKEDEELVLEALKRPNDFLGTFNGKKHSFTIEAVNKDFLIKHPNYVIDFLSENMESASVIDKEILEIKEVKEYIVENIDKNPLLWLDLDSEYKFDKKVVLKVINFMPNLVGKLPIELQEDVDVIREASRDHYPEFHSVEALYAHLDPRAQNNPNICEELVKTDPRVFPQLKMKNDAVIKVALAYNGDYLSCLSEEQRDNEEYVSIALEQNGLALQYASDRLKGDKDIVKIAVSNNGWSINNASKEVINSNPELIDKAISTSPELTSYGWKKSTRKQ